MCSNHKLIRLNTIQNEMTNSCFLKFVGRSTNSSDEDEEPPRNLFSTRNNNSSPVDQDGETCGLHQGTGEGPYGRSGHLLILVL